MSFPDLLQRAFRPDADDKPEYVQSSGNCCLALASFYSLCADVISFHSSGTSI
jgi:hypothetical protein